MQEFRNIIVVPSQDRKGPIFRGGPIWPNWDTQAEPRHCRDNVAVDSEPDTPTQIPLEFSEPMIWGGCVYWQFGHQIAEFSTRLAQSVAQGGDEKILFGVLPEELPTFLWPDAPSHFKEIIDWYRIDRNRVVFCTHPMRIKSLRVARQGEQFIGVPPSPEYLDLLDNNFIENKLVLNRKNFVFVSRGELGSGFGGHAGARYLDAVLEKAGISVFHPEKATIRQQLAVYAGTKNLIFSEGSAIHGLQLLGRNFDSVFVINRKKGRGRSISKMAVHQLTPRCKTLKYFDILKGNLQLFLPNGIAMSNSALSIFSASRLIDVFAEIGVDIKQQWQKQHYELERDNDVISWLQKNWQQHKSRLTVKDQDDLIQELENTGLKHLIKNVRQIINEN